MFFDRISGACVRRRLQIRNKRSLKASAERLVSTSPPRRIPKLLPREQSLTWTFAVATEVGAEVPEGIGWNQCEHTPGPQMQKLKARIARVLRIETKTRKMNYFNASQQFCQRMAAATQAR